MSGSALETCTDRQLIKELKRRHIAVKILQSNVYQVGAHKPNRVSIRGEVFEFQ